MINTWKDVPKRAKNSITAHIEKLIRKYGEKSVRLVVMKLLEKKVKKRLLEESIKEKEKELEDLKKSNK